MKNIGAPATPGPPRDVRQEVEHLEAPPSTTDLGITVQTGKAPFKACGSREGGSDYGACTVTTSERRQPRVGSTGSALLAEYEADIERALDGARTLIGFSELSHLPHGTLAYALFLGRRLERARVVAEADEARRA